MFLNDRSITKIKSDIIKEATITTKALFCNSFQVGHVTLWTSSSKASCKYTFIFILTYRYRYYTLIYLPGILNLPCNYYKLPRLVCSGKVFLYGRQGSNLQ